MAAALPSKTTKTKIATSAKLAKDQAESKAPLVTTKLGNKPASKAKPDSKAAPLPKPDKIKLQLKAALKQPDPPPQDEAPTTADTATSAVFPEMSPPAPTITHVNTALPQAPARKITLPTKRASGSVAPGKLSFNDLVTNRTAPKEAPSPLNDILKYRR